MVTKPMVKMPRDPAALREMIKERDVMIATLREMIKERDGMIAALNERADQAALKYVEARDAWGRDARERDKLTGELEQEQSAHVQTKARLLRTQTALQSLINHYAGEFGDGIPKRQAYQSTADFLYRNDPSRQRSYWHIDTAAGRDMTATAVAERATNNGEMPT